ncbi:MAG: ATP-binding cassette domain-containing protein [Clostridiales bacterium]
MLQLEKVYKIFNEGSLDEKIALNNINLKLENGEFVTIIGSNGAGKSTLMNIVSGGINPDLGKVYINDSDVTIEYEYRRSKLIGRVFQDPNMGTSPSMSIEENLAMAYSRNKTRTFKIAVTKKRRSFFKETLKILHLNLENRLDTKVKFLSGGERQALSLLMATFTEPSMLLLDEHTAALDPARAKLITNLTKEIVNKFNLTTLMVTHNMQQAIDLGTRLIMMDNGKIILDINSEDKKKLTVDSLIDEFHRIKGSKINNDNVLLS